MKGWSEEELRDRDLMAPCGLYCGVCGVYIATRDDNDKFKAVMGNLYGTRPDETRCRGCMQPDPPEMLYGYCFGLATGLRVMQRTIPLWREMVARYGDEEGSVEWARAECERYHCPDCGSPLFRGAQRCRVCKRDVSDDLDGSL